MSALLSYREARLNSFSPLQVHLAEEAFRRLDQCEWLEKRIRALEGRFHREVQHANRIDEVEIARHPRLAAIQFEMELLCEAYYLVAWRMTESLASLPGLKRFSVEGIRDVRNRLIEHPDKKGGVFEWSTSYVTGIGLKLKPMPRSGSQPAHLDRGFWNNVMSLYIEVLVRLGKGIAAQGSRQHPKR